MGRNPSLGLSWRLRPVYKGWQCRALRVTHSLTRICKVLEEDEECLSDQLKLPAERSRISAQAKQKQAFCFPEVS